MYDSCAWRFGTVCHAINMITHHAIYSDIVGIKKILSFVLFWTKWNDVQLLSGITHLSDIRPLMIMDALDHSLWCNACMSFSLFSFVWHSNHCIMQNNIVQNGISCEMWRLEVHLMCWSLHLWFTLFYKILHKHYCCAS